MTDLELAQIKLDVATHRETEAKRQAQLAEAAWLRAIETGSESRSLASHRYWRAEHELERAREQLAQAQFDLRSAELPRVVA